MEEDIDYGTITCLPNEIILIILKNGSHTDIVRFGATCKRFYLLVNSNQYLWKEKCMTILPNDIYNIAQKHGQGQWLEELKRYFNVKEQVYEELASMSPKYYWRVKEIGLEDLSNFFTLALSHNQSYYYVLTILQDVIKRANTQNQNTCKKPFTLTDLYYARIILRYLTQTFLTVKWVQAHMMKTLQPEVVLNFFLQWTDTSEMHSDEEVNDALCEIQEDVEKLFPNDENVPYKNLYDKIHNGVLQERDVLMAISDVIYLNRRLAVMASANLDALNIVKAVKNKCGNAIAAAVVYTGVAARSGIECKLVAFPNHLFLEWKDPTDNRVYKIELDSGILMPKGRCPFSRSTNVEEYTYCPDSLLQFIVSSFLMTMGSLKNCETQNAVYLLDFLSTNPGEDNPYRHFLTYLLNYDHVPSLGLTLELKYLKTEHMDVIRGLSLLKSTQNAVVRESTIHNRDDTILYAVGMVCYHKKYDYVCVVKDWDLSCSAEWRRRIEFKTLSGGSQQPFYCVIAVDQSERYVAQENIVDVAHPSRLYHLEDVIAKEFSHFDGFSYIPNAEKSQEYPDDGRIRDYFKEIFEQKNFNQETDDSF